MWTVCRFINVVIFVAALQGVLAAESEDNISEVLNEFRQRIEILEARDAAKDAKIDEMESKISDLKLNLIEMESIYKQRESMLLNKIATLEKTVTYSAEDVKKDQQTDMTNDSRRSSPPTQRRISRHIISSVKDRAVPETEVAFYATHLHRDIHHLGSNQAIPFQYALTNKGNAFKTSTDAFVAPVDGTYVFHGTITGIDIDSTKHLRAHFDVDGIAYSVFYCSSYLEQSSQMLVIELRAGQTVTIRNDFVDTGFYGQHHTTFSGFLLYQNEPFGTIVGK